MDRPNSPPVQAAGQGQALLRTQAVHSSPQQPFHPAPHTRLGVKLENRCAQRAHRGSSKGAQADGVCTKEVRGEEGAQQRQPRLLHACPGLPNLPAWTKHACQAAPPCSHWHPPELVSSSRSFRRRAAAISAQRRSARSSRKARYASERTAPTVLHGRAGRSASMLLGGQQLQAVEPGFVQQHAWLSSRQSNSQRASPAC